jgi:hypothetical protein
MIWYQSMGHKGPGLRPMCIGTERARTQLLFYTIPFLKKHSQKFDCFEGVGQGAPKLVFGKKIQGFLGKTAGAVTLDSRI